MAFLASAGLVLSTIIYAPQSSNAANNLQIKQVQTKEMTAKAVFSLSEKKENILKKYENSHTLTDKQLKELLWAVGFEGKKLKEAWAIAKKESNGRPLAFNGNTGTGDNSYGIFQINMLGMLGPNRREKFDLEHNADLFNPVINAKIAFHMSNGGENWRAWKGLTPRTLDLMGNFPS